MATSGITSTSPTARQRPKTSAQYLTASALYNAGFRGWPLVVMTALAGREANWNPTALNNNPSTGDYSVGLWQINYFGNLLSGRTAEYGSPSTLLSNPQDQANAAYQLAGGNQLVGLQNWALTPSPKSGQVPLGSTASVGQNTLAKFLPSAISAASEVGTFGPAPASQIAQASNWPGASPLGSALTSGGSASGSVAGVPYSESHTVYATSGVTCSEKASGPGAGSALGIAFKLGPVGVTWCQLKAVLGGLTLTAGGVLMAVGMASLIVGSLGGRSKGAQAIAPTIVVARFAGRSAGRARPRKRSAPSEEVTQADVEEEAA